MIRIKLMLIALLLIIGALLPAALPAPVQAARHHSHTGTIVSISAHDLTIHSKSHSTDYHFALAGSTVFLDHGKQISSARFVRGDYVYVSYSAGPNGTLIAYHVSLRKGH